MLHVALPLDSRPEAFVGWLEFIYWEPTPDVTFPASTDHEGT